MILRLLHHFFVPHSKNNHRAVIIQNSGFLVIAAFLLLLSIFTFSLKKSYPSVLGISYSISTNELLTLTNKARQENGLSPLVMNRSLENAAVLKGKDMLSKNYWAHFAPDGTSPWIFIKNSGYYYIYAGENLARGFSKSDEVMKAWMASPSHRENILSDKYKEIGFAVMDGRLTGEETIVVVQMLGASQVAQAAAVSNRNPIYQSTSIGQKSFENKSEERSLIDIKVTSKSITVMIFIALIFALMLDLLIIEKKKIPRIVGHNIDHILLISLFIFFMVIIKTGGIL